jgi:uncharacterized repeat protein (TIGR01451 family)
MPLFRARHKKTGLAPPAVLPALFLGLFFCLPPASGVARAQTAPPARASQAADSRSRKLKLFDQALSRRLVSQGARLVADYGAFQVLEVEAAAAQTLVANGQGRRADELDFIELNAKRLDTRLDEIKALRKPLAPFGGKRLHLQHFAGPVKPEWRSALEKTGVRIVAYIPNNAYLVYGDAPALGRLQAGAAAADFVQWEGEYLDAYKIHPSVRLVDEKGRPRTPPANLFAVQMVEDADANPATLALIDQIKLEPVHKQSRLIGYLNVTVRMPPERLNDLAARPEVVSILPYFEPRKLDERQDQILAGNLTGGSPNLPTGPGYLAWLATKGFTQAQFTASGFVVDLSVSVIDNGSAAPDHFALYTSGNLTSASRIVYNRLEGTPNGRHTDVLCGQRDQYGDVSSLQAWDGHGNLNAHIIAGYDDGDTSFPHTDSAGYYYGLGVCPFVRVGSSVIFDPYYFTNPDYPTLQLAAYQSGARVSNNSWGGFTNIYDADAQSYDVLARDVGSSAQNRGMVLVFAAGNQGPGAGTVTSPAVAKNVIAVGASENVRSLSIANGGVDAAGNDGSMDDDTTAEDADSMANFSSQGPCSDGRIKPDLVAPGTHVTGGAPQGSPAPSPTGTGSGLACFDGSGVSALPGSGNDGSPDNFFPLNQQFFTESSGTSHSTPAVSGACALLRQYFINQGMAPPSPAMTKAYLMNSARYLAGFEANDNLWSNIQGMGELNLGAAFDGVPRTLQDQSTANTFTSSGGASTIVGVISDPTKPFRVTLAWTDAAGSTTGNSYNNDLDLTVTAGGNTYLGNVFSGAFSTTGGSADLQNNVESVFLPAGVSGAYNVTVTAANINSDAINPSGSVPEQDYALVIYNTAQPPTVAISQSASPSSLALGARVTFTIGVTNLAPGAIANVAVADALPAGFAFLSASSTQGTTVNNSGAVTTSFGSLAASASATVTIQASAVAAGSWVNIAGISPSPASGPVDASASVSVTAVAAPAPVIQPVSLTKTGLVLAWTSTAGATYRVQSSGSLVSPVWTNLTPDVTASGPTASKTIPLPATQQFYRILVVQ